MAVGWLGLVCGCVAVAYYARVNLGLRDSTQGSFTFNTHASEDWIIHVYGYINYKLWLAENYLLT